jgi:hypothetical protein
MSTSGKADKIVKGEGESDDVVDDIPASPARLISNVFLRLERLGQRTRGSEMRSLGNSG